MRIDDLTRSPQTPEGQKTREAEKTDAVRPDGAKTSATSSTGVDSDAASISQLAAQALSPTPDASSLNTSDARLEALRLQVERGEYRVSAEDVAASIIDQHRIG